MLGPIIFTYKNFFLFDFQKEREPHEIYQKIMIMAMIKITATVAMAQWLQILMITFLSEFSKLLRQLLKERKKERKGSSSNEEQH